MKRFSVKNVTFIIPCVIFAAAIFWLVVTLGNTSRNTDEQELAAVRSMIEKGITMCYSIENAYPPDIEYLEENYSISYNKAKYIVHYSCFADNIRPTVSVIERGGL